RRSSASSSPSTRPSRAVWGWGCRSVARSSKHTADGCGRARMRPAGRSFNSCYLPTRRTDIGCSLFHAERSARVSDAAGRAIAIDLAAESDEDDAVSGRVSFVPFDLVVRDDNLFADLPVWTAERTIRAFVGDDGDIAILVHLEAVGPIGIGFAAARHEWGVGLHELLKPRAHVRRLVLPLSQVARSCR